MNRTIVLMPDLHAPVHDRQALAAFLEGLAAIHPDELLILGDFIDCHAPARWSKGSAAEYADSLPGELEAGKAVLQQIRDHYPDGEISFIKGNHEARIDSYLHQYAPAISGLVPPLSELLGFGDVGVTLRSQPYAIAPGVVAIHGKLLSSVLGGAGQSAFKERQRHGTSVIQGHTHRLGIGWDHQERDRFWMECGHLCDTEQMDYLDFKGQANWQAGFGVLHVRGERVFPSVHAIHNGMSAFGQEAA